MNQNAPLEHAAPDFGHLPNEDRQAILQFTLLWSLFEAKALQTRASANGILLLVQAREAEGRLQPNQFNQALNHFRQRYFANGQFTALFQGLNLRANDKPALVKEVLKGESNDPARSVAALLIIILRLRNNLFHGVKWAYGIQGQRSNFEQANAALGHAIEQLAEHGA